jgi:hypothetical protein
MSPYSQTTRRISQVHPASLKFRFEDAVFFAPVGHDVILVVMEPGCEPGDQELEAHGPTSG